MDREKIIVKLEKEVKKTYSIKTTIYNNGTKVNEDITEHREPGIKISMEMADEILAMLKEQEEKPLRCDKCCYHREDGWCAMQEQWVRETDYCSFGAWEG